MSSRVRMRVKVRVRVMVRVKVRVLVRVRVWLRFGFGFGLGQAIRPQYLTLTNPHSHHLVGLIAYPCSFYTFNSSLSLHFLLGNRR